MEPLLILSPAGKWYFRLSGRLFRGKLDLTTAKPCVVNRLHFQLEAALPPEGQPGPSRVISQRNMLMSLALTPGLTERVHFTLPLPPRSADHEPIPNQRTMLRLGLTYTLRLTVYMQDGEPIHDAFPVEALP